MPKIEKIRNEKTRNEGTRKSVKRVYDHLKPKSASELLADRLSQMNLNTGKISQEHINSVELAKIGVKDITLQSIDQSLKNLQVEYGWLFHEQSQKTNIKQIIEWNKLLNMCDKAQREMNDLRNSIEVIEENPQAAESYWIRVQNSTNPYLSRHIDRLKVIAYTERQSQEPDPL